MYLKSLYSLLICVAFSSISYAQPGFMRNYGGENDDIGNAMIQTRTGDFVITGYTSSFGAKKTDIWVVKLDRFGNVYWKKRYGGKGIELAHAIIETTTGDYVIAGRSDNNAIVFQLSAHGKLMWYKKYGGDKEDAARDIIETQDGGFAVAGYVQSNSKGASDIWVLRLDDQGNKLWAKSFGDFREEIGKSIIQTQDGNLVIAGYRDMSDSKERKNTDMLLMKINDNGELIWGRKVFGKEGNDVAETVLELPSGELFLSGWTSSEGAGKIDGLVMRLNKLGRPIWKHTYGGTGRDFFSDAKLTRDGYLVCTGVTAQPGSVRGKDMWMLQVDENGEVIWERRFNGEKDDSGRAIVQTTDGGFASLGVSSTFSKGGRDFWLVKTNEIGQTIAMPDMLADAESRQESDEDQVEIDQEAEKNLTLEDRLKPNLYVLAVGISRYDDPTVNLTYAHTDAAAIADRLKKLEGSIYRKVEVKKILNEDANLVNIKTGISWAERQATQKDVILMFISSHGALDHKGNLYILPTDFNSYNLFATALNIRDLTEGTNGVNCKKLILLDACHSGQVGQELISFASLKAANLNSLVDEIVNKEPGVTVMTSSSGREFSYENPRWGHGAFTKAILEGFDGNADYNKDSAISLLELNLWVTERVKTLTDGRQHPYTPINLFGDLPLYWIEE